MGAPTAVGRPPRDLIPGQLDERTRDGARAGTRRRHIVTLVLLSIRIKPRAGRYLPGKMPYDQAVHTSPAAPGRVSRACCSPVAAIALRREAPWPLQRLRSCRCTVDPEEPQKRLQTFSRSCSGCRPISSCSYSPTGCSSVAGALPHCSPGRRRRTPGLCTTAYCTIFHSSRFTLRHGSCWMAGYGRTWLCSATPPSGRGASRRDRLAVSPEGFSPTANQDLDRAGNPP